MKPPRLASVCPFALWLAWLGCASEPATEGRAPLASSAAIDSAPSALDSNATPLLSTGPIAPRSDPTKPAAPLLGRDHHSAVACKTDDDCGWDDDCFPKRCVERRPRGACDESMQPPGSCLCIQGSCTNKPSKTPIATGPCETRGCVVDRALGACVADTGGVAENIRTNPGLDRGPSCDCVTPANGCTFSWFEPVRCNTERDCWVEELPRPHPVARPKHLGGRAFKPCTKDGEIQPACDKGFCALGPHFKC